MTLELRLKRFWFLPDWIQTGNGEPRRAHIVGKNEPASVDKGTPGRDKFPQERNTGKYRPLASITHGEVDDAMRHFMPQMVPSPAEGWIARNYFCQLPVRQRTGEQSPVVFGRVRTSFPSEGNVQNIEQMEIQFPNLEAAPDLLNIRRSDIHWQGTIQSYCVGVKMYLSEAEREDFSRSDNIFIEKGFAPIYETGYLSLLDGPGARSYFHALAECRRLLEEEKKIKKPRGIARLITGNCIACGARCQAAWPKDAKR